MKNDFKLKCIKHCRRRSDSDYLIKLNWSYNKNGVSLDVHIPKGSIVIGAINDNIIYEGDILNKNIDYGEDIVLKIKNKSTGKYDDIHISPKRDVNVDKSDDELKNNLVGPYENTKITQTGAEELDEQDNLMSILDKLSNVEKIGRGGFRSVYDISEVNIDFLHKKDGNIIKVAMHKRSLKQNRREVQT